MRNPGPICTRGNTKIVVSRAGIFLSYVQYVQFTPRPFLLSPEICFFETTQLWVPAQVGQATMTGMDGWWEGGTEIAYTARRMS